jgi:hypothetical protein
MKRSWLRSLFLLVLATGLLSGCATGYLLDNQVQSFSGLPSLPANPTYRFERLPSQQATANQAQLEALADPALFKAGLRRDDASPRYTVQVSARLQLTLSPWAEPDWGWGPLGWGGLGYGRHGYGGLGYAGYGYRQPFGRMEPPWHQREVGVVVRELSSGKVVFESRASNDGPILDPNVVLAAMFEAAMQGFPNTPAGPRRVDIQLGGKKG